jgi:methionyl-tRNA formyltransferase
VRLVFAGTPEPALPALRSLIDSPRHEVIAVLTRPDAASGRHGTPQPSPVARLALEQGIPVLRPPRPNTPEFVAELSELAPDCCPVVAYGALLRDELLAVPAHGWVNLHFSLLPAWRGDCRGRHRHRRHDVSNRGRYGLRAGLRSGHRGGPADRHRRGFA